MNRQKGFTLIELLVVIAIIGILSAIVLASLNTARNRAQDSKVQAQLSSMRAAAEIYYGGSNSYGPAVTGCVSGLSGIFADTNSGMGNLASSTPGIKCGSSNTAWAAAAPLVSDTANSWCVDSTGKSKQVLTSAVTDGLTVCP